MPFKIVRNDITRMQTDAIVNTANALPTVGSGCDHAIYEAAGQDDLLSYRKEHIGTVKEGEFDLVNFIYTGSLGRLDEPESIAELMSWSDKINCVCAMNDKPVIQKEDLIC